MAKTQLRWPYQFSLPKFVSLECSIIMYREFSLLSRECHVPVWSIQFSCPKNLLCSLACIILLSEVFHYPAWILPSSSLERSILISRVVHSPAWIVSSSSMEYPFASLHYSLLLSDVFKFLSGGFSTIINNFITFLYPCHHCKVRNNWLLRIIHCFKITYEFAAIPIYTAVLTTTIASLNSSLRRVPFSFSYFRDMKESV